LVVVFYWAMSSSRCVMDLNHPKVVNLTLKANISIVK
jgi:hypothetical protein